MTFSAYDNKYKQWTHKLRKIRLGTGSQGLADGFVLSGVCTAEGTQTEIDLLEDNPIDCEDCLAWVKGNSKGYLFR